MKQPCNRIYVDEAALMAALRNEAKDALELEGQRLLAHMQREVMNTTHGSAPGKPDWRKEISDNLDKTAVAVTDDSVSMDFGYSPADKADMVRAMVVVAGSGKAARGNAITAGPTGRSVWNSELDSKHPSRAKSVYKLPDEFNQKGNQFVENAVRMMKDEFGILTELTFQTTPDSVYYGNVTVSKK